MSLKMDRNPKMKSRLIAAALKQKIRNRKMVPGSPLPSAREIALQYKVCMMTANRALDILEQSALIERRKGVGNFVRRNVVRGHRLLLGIADTVGPSSDYARNLLLDVFPVTAMNCFKSENCDFRIIPYSDLQAGNISVPAELDGILVNTTFIDSQTADFVRSLKIPVVLYRSEYELDFPLPQVIPDHSAAMDRLFSLAAGEEFNGIMIFAPSHPNGMARCRAFEFYARKHGFSADRILPVKVGETEFYRTVLRLVPEIPGKLVITCSDLMTVELIQLFSENSLVCGSDYQLVSYDNLNKLMRMPPGIPGVTSIDYSRTAAARTAARLLIQYARNPNSVCYQTVKFPTRLMIRESAFQSRKELI